MFVVHTVRLTMTHSPPPTASAPACRSHSGPETRWIVGRCWAHCSWNTDPDRPWETQHNTVRTIYTAHNTRDSCCTAQVWKYSIAECLFWSNELRETFKNSLNWTTACVCVCVTCFGWIVACSPCVRRSAWCFWLHTRHFCQGRARGGWCEREEPRRRTQAANTRTERAATSPNLKRLQIIWNQSSEECVCCFSKPHISCFIRAVPSAECSGLALAGFAPMESNQLFTWPETGAQSQNEARELCSALAPEHQRERESDTTWL